MTDSERAEIRDRTYREPEPEKRCRNCRHSRELDEFVCLVVPLRDCEVCPFGVCDLWEKPL